MLFNFVVADDRITLLALNSFLSPAARVTSEKSSSFQRFLMSSGEFVSKSFQETKRVSSASFRSFQVCEQQQVLNRRIDQGEMASDLYPI